MIKTTINTDIELNISCKCEKCNKNYSYSHILYFHNSYYGTKVSVLDCELEAKQKHKENIENTLKNIFEDFSKEDYKGLAFKKCPNCDYLQHWQIDTYLNAKRIERKYVSIFSFVILLIASFFGFKYIGESIDDMFLKISMYFVLLLLLLFIIMRYRIDMKKDKQKQTKLIDQLLPKHKPSIDFKYIK